MVLMLSGVESISTQKENNLDNLPFDKKIVCYVKIWKRKGKGMRKCVML